MKYLTTKFLLLFGLIAGLVSFALGMYSAKLDADVQFESDAVNTSRLVAHKINIDLRTLASMNEDNPIAFLEAPTIDFIPKVTQTLIEDDIARLKQSKRLSDEMANKFRSHFAGYTGFIAGNVLRVISVETEQSACSVMNDPKAFKSISDLVKEKINLKKGTTFCYVMTAETLKRMKYPVGDRKEVYFSGILTAAKGAAPKSDKKSENKSGTSVFL